MPGKGKVIFVVTNHSKLGDTGKNTGWYLPEVAHPYDVLTKAGYEVTFVSPKGGKAPMDEGSGEAFKGDAICQAFLKNDVSKLDKTLTPEQVKPGDFKAIFYAGGHGPMFDLPDAKNVADLGAKVYEQGGVVAAVCHGTVGLVPIKLSTGKMLVEGKTVTCFTDKEEAAVQLVDAMPFLLETRLKKMGAKFVGEEDWTCNVQVFNLLDGTHKLTIKFCLDHNPGTLARRIDIVHGVCDRIVTGQNPQSATKLGEEMVKLLK